jgi:glycosyltransferase involved in cell wall biosynthesis
VVICAYESRWRIGRALAALRGQELGEPFEVIAVISGSDGCERFVANDHPDVRVIYSPERIVPGRARNLGVRSATGPFVAFVPDDGIAAPGWLCARLRHHRSGSELVAGAISNGTPRSLIGTAAYYVEYAASLPVQRVLERQSIPHTLSYAREVFDRVGWFPEIDVPGEDTLFNSRCVAAGLTCAFEPNAVVAHLNLDRLKPFLEHQAQHGRGLARCAQMGLNGPFGNNDRGIRLAVSALLSYPLRRWVQTMPLMVRSGLRHTVRFLTLTPIIVAGYFAGGWGSWLELSRAPRHRP